MKWNIIQLRKIKYSFGFRFIFTPIVFLASLLFLFQNCGPIRFSQPSEVQLSSSSSPPPSLDRPPINLTSQKSDPQCGKAARSPATNQKPIMDLCNDASVNTPVIDSSEGDRFVWNCESKTNQNEKVSCYLNKPLIPTPTRITVPPKVKVNGRCGSVSISGFAQSLTSSSPGLCSIPGSTVVEFSGNGPWTWRCSGVNNGDSSPVCSAGIGFTKACSSSSILVGIQGCTKSASSTTEQCGPCQADVCAVGYERDITNYTCKPLNYGNCNVPASTIHLYPQNTITDYSCWTDIGADTLSVGQVKDYLCSRTSKVSATLRLKCDESSVADQIKNNGGQSYLYKRLQYDRGFDVNDTNGEWFYAVFDSSKTSEYGVAANIHINLGPKLFSWNFPCNSGFGGSTSEYGGMNFSGQISEVSPSSVHSGCFQSFSGGYSILKIQCTGRPGGNASNYGDWKIIDGLSEATNSGVTCSGTKNGQNYSAPLNAWN